MKVFLSLYFFMIAIIQTGLLFGISHYFQSQNLTKANQYWLGSLLSSSAALFVFGAGILGVEDVSRPAFNFTIANLFFYLAGLLQTIFCISLNKPISKRLVVICIVSCPAFIAFFEFLRINSTFETRTLFMVCMATTFYCLQILEVRKACNQDQSKQLIYLQIVTSLELLFAVSRLIVLLVTGFGVKSVEQLPQLLILFTLGQLVMNTLSYIAIAGYKFERISYAKAKSDSEKAAAEIKIREMADLLKEKERLIYGLLKANKTAATGALSASIAHELNQPLGASSLNIQFLKTKLEKGALNPELGREILESLEEDNKRAATIVKSLRSIFTESDTSAQKLVLNDLISKVVDVVRPEVKSKNIQLQLNIADDLIVKVNSTDIEQVVLNLVNNSIQSLANSGTLQRRIAIEAFKEGQMIHLTIADNGSGVSQEFKPQLFELLSTTKQTGMGLGLWLCKHIVTRYMGTIEYKDAVGGGAKFLIRLPSASLG